VLGPGNGYLQHNLLIVAVNYLGSGVNVTPPMATGPDHPGWVLIDTRVAGSPADFTQLLYWHPIGSAETGAPQFTFTFDSSVRAAAAGVGYQGTCTEDLGPICGPHGQNPIDGVAGSISNNSGTVNTGGAIAVPVNGTSVVAFGGSNTTVFFGGPGSPSGTAGPGLTPETNNSGQNSSIAIYDKFEPAGGTDGPFTATLPNSQLGDNVGQSISIFPTDP
jgi:hypothetical protein